MKRNAIAFIHLLIVMALLGLTGCSRTVDDVAKWKAKGHTEKLIKALADPKIEVRLAAAEALGELQAEPAVDSLASLYNDSEETVILASVEALAEIGSPSITTPMIAALKLDYLQARLTAATTLGELKATGAINQLAEALNDAEADVQLAAAISLGQIGDESGSEGLVGKLNANSPALRQACVVSLGQTGGDVAAGGLIRALGDENNDVSQAAIQSLENLGAPCVPFLLEALKNENIEIRRGTITTLQELHAVPESGSDLIWYELALASVNNDDEIDPDVAQILIEMGEPAYDTLLEAAAHPVKAFREYAAFTLEHTGKPALKKSVAATDTNAGSSAKKWMAKRGSWPGAPSWRIDLWASLAALNPQFNLDTATANSLEMQARPAYNIISRPQFEAQRETIPLLIALLGDTTEPPPEEPDYDAEGIPVIKKNRDLFRGATNRQLAKEKLSDAGYMATLPLIAAIEDEDELIAGSAADILGIQGEKRALHPLMNVVETKLQAGDPLTDSPFYNALQKMDEPEAEPLLLKIRPNPDRAMRVFERKYPGIRPMSSETKDTTRNLLLPIDFRLGYINKGRVGELMVTFMKNEEGNWVPSPPLPDQLPSM
ncbi:HEAT repeat domain-containing protein [Pontiellaceae bacterium B1224]|nr:HEAT repeat domain-containing protein [Pontiellaceae bacterium B1224]